MIQFDQDILLDAFSSLPFKVQGVGIHKNIDEKLYVVKFVDGEYERIGLNDTENGGYLRFTGKTGNAREGEKISCSDQIYYETAEIHLVIGLTGKNMQSVFDNVKMRVAQIYGTKIKATDINKENILKEEGIAPNQLEMFKIVFDYEYTYVAPCANELTCCD